MNRGRGSLAPLHYELVIQGHLDERWSVWFGGLALARGNDGTTTLRGAVADQAELYGLLGRVRDLGANLISVTPIDRSTSTPRSSGAQLSTRRLNVMRFGYAFMGVGLVIVKWPLLIQGAASLPVMDGVVTCLLTAMSLLAFLGLRYPAQLLPILLFEVAWKTIWMTAVALPHLTSGALSPEVSSVLFSCSFVVVIIAVIPWGYTWRRYVRTPGDPWRSTPGNELP